MPEEVGLSDRGTVGGTMATGLTPKLGRIAELARADKGCSIELVDCDDRIDELERAEGG